MRTSSKLTVDLALTDPPTNDVSPSLVSWAFGTLSRYPLGTRPYLQRAVRPATCPSCLARSGFGQKFLQHLSGLGTTVGPVCNAMLGLLRNVTVVALLCKHSEVDRGAERLENGAGFPPSYGVKAIGSGRVSVTISL